MSRPFTPSAFLFCDFASEDSDGRVTVAGIHPGLGNYRSARYFPRFVAAIIHPLTSKSDLQMRVRGPSGALKLSAGYEGDADPQDLDQLTFIIPLHRMGPTSGHYEISLGENDDTLEVVCEFDLATLPKVSSSARTSAVPKPSPEAPAKRKRRPTK